MLLFSHPHWLQHFERHCCHKDATSDVLIYSCSAFFPKCKLIGKFWLAIQGKARSGDLQQLSFQRLGFCHQLATGTFRRKS